MMTFSCSYHKRKHYLNKLKVPPFSEAKNQLGNELTQVLMDECPESLRSKMRLSNPLQGPGENLWISPSDLLVGKVVLTPPLTAKHVKALTHEGILNVGEEIEAQWLAAVDLEKRLAMENLEELLMLLADRDKERATKTALQNCEQEFRKYMENVNHEFEQVLLSELAALEKSLREYYEKLIEEQINSTHQIQDDFLKEQIEDVVDSTVQQLTEKFMQDLEQQEQELEAMFKAKLDGQQERHKLALQYQEDVFAAVMKQLKHNLQCNNLASLMYVMCLERRKCNHEEQQLVNATTQQMHELQYDLKHRNQEIHELKCELKEKQRKLQVREQCLKGVIAQFQKFINYALKASPMQAEFLLSIEKMMTLELTQALAKTQELKKPHVAKMLMPWKKVSEENYVVPEIKSVPYHDCLNEEDAPPCGDNFDLFAMSYDNRWYIREDFRNRVLQPDFTTSRTTELWSKEVGDLIKLIQGVNYDYISGEALQTQPRVAQSINMNMTKESVQFARTASVALPEPVGLLATKDSMDSIKEGTNQTDEMEEKHPSGVALLATTDSVTMMKEKHGTSMLLLTPIQNPDDVVIEVVQAPSTATIQINKVGPRRVTTYPSASDIGGVTLSNVNIKLSRNPNSISGPRPKAMSSMSTRLNISARESPAFGLSEPTTSSGFPLDKPKRISYGRVIHESKVSRYSALSQHRNSLELISTANKTSTSKKIKNIIMPTTSLDPEYPTQQYVISAPTETRDFPEVNFKKVADVFTEVYKPETPWEIYRKTSVAKLKKRKVTMPDDFLKVKPAIKVIGSSVEEDNKTQQDFTIHRIHSIMDILKKDDSLIRMFTKCGQ